MRKLQSDYIKQRDNARQESARCKLREEMMSRKVSRRTLLASTGAAAALGCFPAPAIAQTAPIKIGLLTVKVGPLAQGGIQMEQGVLTFLKETNYTIAGRKVDFISADTGGAPAGAKTKAQELVERDKVDLILGPLATFELYAINDYIQQQKLPTLSLAAADNLTQRLILICCAPQPPRPRLCIRWATTQPPR
jgi:branched-chain amino acid transport system substrate-binding protein